MLPPGQASNRPLRLWLVSPQLPGSPGAQPEMLVGGRFGATCCPSVPRFRIPHASRPSNVLRIRNKWALYPKSAGTPTVDRCSERPETLTHNALSPRERIQVSLFQSKDEPEGSEGSAKRVLSFRVLNSIHASSRGGGNVGIAPLDGGSPQCCSSDFQGWREGRKTALSFSGLSTNRHFLGPCAPVITPTP
jgi:hypothetical protein